MRTDEMEVLLARAERLGNRLAASVLIAAVIDGVAQLATQRHRRCTNIRGPGDDGDSRRRAVDASASFERLVTRGLVTTDVTTER